MKIFLYTISIILLLSSCCDTNTTEDYDHTYDRYLPEKGGHSLLFFSTSDTNQSDTLKIISDVTETTEIKVNGDGCRQNFIQRTVELDIPETNESSFSLSTNGYDESLEYTIRYPNSIIHSGYVYYNNTVEDIADYDCIYKSLEIGGITYDRVMQFVIPESVPVELKRIFLAENHGIMQIIYKNGDTLIRR